MTTARSGTISAPDSDRLRDVASLRDRPVGTAIVLDGRGYVDAGRRGRVRLLRQVHVQRLDQSRRPRGGTIVSRMVDEPQGEGYSVVWTRARCRSTWSSAGSTTRSASRRRTALARRQVDASRGHVRRLACRHGREGLPGRRARGRWWCARRAESIVLRPRQPLRLGSGGGPGSRFDGAHR